MISSIGNSHGHVQPKKKLSMLIITFYLLDIKKIEPTCSKKSKFMKRLKIIFLICYQLLKSMPFGLPKNKLFLCQKVMPMSSSTYVQIKFIDIDART